MPTLIEKPVRIEAAGNKPKLIDEFVGRVNTRDSAVSIARMRSPSGWIEPGQRPEFDEYTVVLLGMLRVEHEGGPDRRPGRAGRRGAAGRVGALQHARACRAPSTSRCACRHSRPRRSTAIRRELHRFGNERSPCKERSAWSPARRLESAWSRRELARKGARVILVGRSTERCSRAADEIRAQAGTTAVEWLVADLSSQADIRRLADQVRDPLAAPGRAGQQCRRDFHEAARKRRRHRDDVCPQPPVLLSC